DSKTTLPANATEEERQNYLAGLRNSPSYKEEMKKYGTGSDMQRGIQAATAALQGLAGGNIGGALAGASAPELANIIGHHAGIDDNDEAKAVAHAILGGVTAALQGNSAAAGVAGGATGELIAGAIAKVLYPDVKDLSTLSEDQKQTLSTLASISSGMAGGIAGRDISGAAAGASAGKNAVENNFLGTEEDQIKAVQRHGADVLSCADNPSGAACQRGISENKAYAGALAAAGLIYLPGGMQVTAGIGGTANAGIQYAINGSVNPTDVLIASYVGAFTAETGLWGTVGWNAAGGATSNLLKGDDPLTGGAISGLGAGLGYGIGSKLIKPGLDKFINPNWKNWEWVDVGMGISKPMPLNPLPGALGTAGGGTFTEIFNDQAGKGVEKLKKDVK
uniref:VENN motif pre-toxin domain-containing protein n=1 Tax=Cedecea sulfonylureivorans TaxID=3051154 RepID=UPI0019274C8B